MLFLEMHIICISTKRHLISIFARFFIDTKNMARWWFCNSVSILTIFLRFSWDEMEQNSDFFEKY